MLYPQNNGVRTMVDLGGIWEFRFAEDKDWQRIAVPASYNDQSPDPRFRAKAGTVVYRTRISVPALWRGMKILLRFDADKFALEQVVQYAFRDLKALDMKIAEIGIGDVVKTILAQQEAEYAEKV